MIHALGVILLLMGAGLIIEEASPPWVHFRAGLGILLLLIGIGLVLSTRVIGG
jgi:membrane-bound ClpP family serine protease